MCANIFTIKEVEAILKINDKQVRNLLTFNKLEYFKVSGKVRISEEHIDSYLKSVKVPAA